MAEELSDLVDTFFWNLDWWETSLLDIHPCQPEPGHSSGSYTFPRPRAE